MIKTTPELILEFIHYVSFQKVTKNDVDLEKRFGEDFGPECDAREKADWIDSDDA